MPRSWNAAAIAIFSITPAFASADASAIAMLATR
jgi:hypothetical protein